MLRFSSPGEIKTFLLKLVASKRAMGVALATVLLFGVGNASAEFNAGTSSEEPAATTGASQTPDPSPTEEAGITPAGGGGGNINNEVVVINTVDGRAAHRAGFGVARVTGDNANNQNAAAATSSCSDCRTVAVAAQAVIIQRTDASNISPKNYAIALNRSCMRCETFAAAYQYVFTTDGLVRFSAGAEQKLAGLQGQIRAVAGDEDLSFPDMEAKIDALVESMWSLVRSELEAVGVQGVGRAAKDTDETTEDTGDPSPSPSPSKSPSPSPSGSPTGSPTTNSGAEASPTPTKSTSPSPQPSETASPTPTG